MASKFGTAYIDVDVKTAGALAKLKAFQQSANKILGDIDKRSKDLDGPDMNWVDEAERRIGRLSEKVKGLGTDMQGLNKVSKNVGRDLEKSFDIDLKDFTSHVGNLGNDLDRVHTSTDKVEGSMGRLNDRTKRGNVFLRAYRKVVGDLDRGMDGLARRIKPTGSLFASLNDHLKTSWARMDSTVRVVIGLIATAGGPLTAALSGASAAATALGSSLAFAALGASSLVAVLPGLAYGIGLAVSGFQRIDELAPKAGGALADLKSAFADVDVPAFMREWEDSLAGFFSALSESLRGDTLAASLGQTFSKITDAFTNVINGDLWGPFIDAAEGPLATALGNVFGALEPLINTLLQFMTEAAPFAVTLSEMFGQWATNLQAAFGESVASGKFAEDMQKGVEALDGLLGLLGSVKDFLGTVFSAGVDSGNQLLGMLTNVFDTWTEFLNSTQGQNALEEWFSNGLKIMEALGPALAGLGQAFANMVTPATVQMMVNLFDLLGQFLPILGSIIETISHLGVLDLLAQLFLEIGKAVEPILPVLRTLASTIFIQLGNVISALAPILSIAAEIIGELAEALGPVIQEAAKALIDIMGQLVPIFETVWQAIQPLIPIIANLLVSAIQLILPFISELIAKLGPLLTGVINALMPVIQALVPIIESLLPVFVQLIPLLFPVINLIAQLAPIILPLIEVIADLVTWVLNLIAPFIDFLVPLLEWVAQLIVLNKGIGIVSGAISKWAKGVAENFKKVWDWVVNLWNRIKQWFDDMVNGVKNMGSNFWKWIKDLWTKVTNGFTNGVSRVVETVKGWVTNVINFVRDLQTRAVNIVKSLWESIKTRFKDSVTSVYNTVKGWIDKVVNFFSGLWGRISSGLGNIGEKIKGKFGDLVGFARGLVDDIVGWFKKLPTKIGNALSGLGGVITNAIGNVAEKLNPLNWFASGGIVTGPTAAMVGEAGPEAIVPLNRPLHMVDPSVRDLSAALQGQPNQMAFRNGGIAGAAGITIAEGAIQVIAPESNPDLVAESVLDRLVAYAR